MSSESKAPASFRDEILVTPEAIDKNGHVNNVVFVQWMQDSAIRHFAAAGGLELGRAVGGTWVVRTHHVDYLNPAFVGDRLEVITWIVDFGRARSLRRYKFIRRSDGKLLVRGETNWVFVNASTGRPASIPETIRERFVLQPPDQEPS